MHPRLEALGVAQVRDLAPGGDEGVLQRVLGEARVAEDPERDRVQPVAHPVHQGREGVAVAAPGPFDEVSIHLGLRWPRLG